MKELRHLQAEITQWQSRVCPPEKRTPQSMYNRSLEEMRELSKAIENQDGTPERDREIALEGTDVIIRMLGIIAVVGGNATELLNEKIEEIQKKYPAHEIERKIQTGVGYDDVMRQHKNNWRAPVVPLYTGFVRRVK